MRQDTLLLYGTDSNCLPAGKKLKKKIRDAALLELRGDHNIPIQEPVSIGNIIETFFNNG